MSDLLADSYFAFAELREVENSPILLRHRYQLVRLHLRADTQGSRAKPCGASIPFNEESDRFIEVSIAR